MGLALEVKSHNNVSLGEQVSAPPDAKQRIQGRRFERHIPKWHLHRNKGSKEGPEWVPKTAEYYSSVEGVPSREEKHEI